MNKEKKELSLIEKFTLFFVYFLVLVIVILTLIYSFQKIQQFIIQKKYITKDYMLECRNSYGDFGDAFSAIQLMDGRIFIFGGEKKAPYRPEIYDPQTRKSTLKKDFPYKLDYPSMVLLNDGKVLIVGCTKSKIKSTTKNTKNILSTKAVIYDPIKDTYSKFIELGNLGKTKVLKLQDGRIFFLSGINTLGGIFDPLTKKIKRIKDPKKNCISCNIELLDNGNIIMFSYIVPSSNKDVYSVPSKDIDSLLIYNPKKEQYKVGSKMSTLRREAKCINWSKGRKLFWGGLSNGAINLIEVYNPKTNKFENIGSLKKARATNGGVLINENKLYFPANNSSRNYNPFELGEPIKFLLTEAFFLTKSKPNCEVFDLKTKTSYYTPICPDSFKYGSYYFMQPNGKLIIVGGCSQSSTPKQCREILTIDVKEIK